ncbi:MAG: threonine ammonia-lyase [Deltaproteobacteria bacterium]|nr:threonine ammonia-lyase [Deltaproteobacteria bacterium]MCF8118811.1 threonine ammonia-lyase [Deltaproteobacteria bacterium]
MTVTLQDIRDAAEAIQGKVKNTLCVPSVTLSQITGTNLVLKFENLQFTASFKERGALNKLLTLSPQSRKAGVIAMSAGNHAQAVAYHARNLGIRAVIVMPRYTPNLKVEHTRAFGAEVILKGEDFDEAVAFTQKIAAQRGLELIHPYDDEKIIAGQGTVALEMLEAFPDLECLVVPVGGGGFIAGCAVAAKSVNPDIAVMGVEAQRYACVCRALNLAAPEWGRSTIAEGIAVKAPGAIPLEIIKANVDTVLLVDEGDMEEAVLLLLEVEKTVVEGAGAAGLAALMKHPDLFSGKKVGLILSGGNIDLLSLSSIIQRGLVRTGRLVRLRVELRDCPGSLSEVTRRIADAEANIMEVHHQRAFTELPLQSAEVEFVLQTRGLSHVRALIKELKSAGYDVHRTAGGGKIVAR